jgi:hypothetical protein
MMFYFNFHFIEAPIGKLELKIIVLIFEWFTNAVGVK